MHSIPLTPVLLQLWESCNRLYTLRQKLPGLSEYYLVCCSFPICAPVSVSVFQSSSPGLLFGPAFLFWGISADSGSCMVGQSCSKSALKVAGLTWVTLCSQHFGLFLCLHLNKPKQIVGMLLVAPIAHSEWAYTVLWTSKPFSHKVLRMHSGGCNSLGEILA